MKKFSKRFFIFFNFLLFCSLGFSFENKFYIDIEPLYYLQNGTLFEYVMVKNPVTNSEEKLSELDWNIKNISYTGAKLVLGWNFIDLETSYLHGFNKSSDIMTDYDWQDSTDPSMCTNKSINENTLNESYNFELKLNLNFNIFSSFFISPFLGFNYSFISFSGKNGYGWYGDSNNTNLSYNVPYYDAKAKYYEKGELFGIGYERTTYDLKIGTSLNYTLFDYIKFSLSASISPYTEIQSIDFHHGNRTGTSGTYYYDVMSGYFKSFSFSGNINTIIWEKLSADISFDYHLQNMTYGVTYISTEKKFYSHNLSKDSYSACAGKWWNVGFGVKYSF